MTEFFFKAISIVTPFISALLVYFFAIKSKKKEIDIQKEKELNCILGDLLEVWFYLKKIKRTMSISSADFSNSVIPKNVFPIFAIKSGLLDDNCLKELDDSIELIKKYDPILYFKLKGRGNELIIIKNKSIEPILKSIEDISNLINLEKTTNKLLTDLNFEIEDELKMIASLISRKCKRDLLDYLHEYTEENIDDFINTLNLDFYENLRLAHNNVNFPTYEEFLKEVKSEDGQKFIRFQMNVMLNDSLPDLMNTIKDNPSVSLEDLLNKFNK